METQIVKKENIIYPDSDGQPMADNTKQFNWIVLIKEGLEAQTCSGTLWRENLLFVKLLMCLLSSVDPKAIEVRTNNGKKTTSPHKWFLRLTRQATLLLKCSVNLTFINVTACKNTFSTTPIPTNWLSGYVTTES